MSRRNVKIVFTTDIHGNYFSLNFRHGKWGKGSLQRVHGYVADLCNRKPGSTILIDGGDLLQGEPTSYYFNYIDKSRHHRVADFCNFIGYDLSVIGNHDIECGHSVFDKFVEDCNFPVLGANVLNTETGKPYFEPYVTLRRSGLRVTFIGFITPAIPHWTPKTVWSGMEFTDIRTAAEKWIGYVREHESPDMIVGVFHSGMDEGIVTPTYRENAVRETVSQVNGFDLILYGHDHASYAESIPDPKGKEVVCINPGNNAYNIAEIDIEFDHDEESGLNNDIKLAYSQKYIGKLQNSHTNEFQKVFKRDIVNVKRFANETLGELTNSIDIHDSYFGSSAYIDLIQSLQLKLSGADISFSAPLFFNAHIDAGTICVTHLFEIYRFEDHLFTVRLTGQEIKDYLEMSYSLWIHQMQTSEDNMLQIAPMRNCPERLGFINFIFNFDSAAGIIYDVDVTKPTGQRIIIHSMDDGSPFSAEKTYRVAMTAYRANGGGELLTKGACLTKEEIDSRIESITEHDIRYYLMQHVRDMQSINPMPRNHWRFIPETICKPAIEREREMLFGINQSC